MLIEWIHCPICGGKTRNKIRGDTELRNYPLYCPKCKKESLIDVKRLQVTVIKEPDAKTQSRWTCEVTHSSSALYKFDYAFLLQLSSKRFVPVISASTKSIIRLTFAEWVAETSFSHNGLTCFSIPVRYYCRTVRRSCKSFCCSSGVNVFKKNAAIEKIFVS